MLRHLIRFSSSHRFIKIRNYSRNVTLSAAEYNSSCTTENGAPCSGYSFDASVMRDTVVTDHGLVCDRLPLLPVVGSSYMAGIMIANVVAGYLADRLGRRTGAVGYRTKQTGQGNKYLYFC